MVTMQVLLSIELGETTPRQRTILRREMLQQGWTLTSDRMMFTAQIDNLESDEEIVHRVTDELKQALEVADIVDWGADCFIKSKVGKESNSRLTSS